MVFQFRRVPRWIVAVGVGGTIYSLITRGPLAGLVCAVGAAGSWWNYRHLVNATTSVVNNAASGGGTGVVWAVGGMFLRFAIVAGGALAILEYSRTNLIPLFLGLFASFIGVGLEIIYELVWTKNTTSG
jgi:hypothetical protein